MKESSMRGALLVLTLIAVLGGLLAGPTAAQPAGSAAGSAAPAAGSAAPAPAPGSAAAIDPATPPVQAPPADPAAGELRKTCVAAMNADPTFADAIVKTANEAAARQRDADTVASHLKAHTHVAKNQRHVILSYAAMWIIAALFVIFLWRRQQALRGEIVQLRRDLAAAAKEGK